MSDESTTEQGDDSGFFSRLFGSSDEWEVENNDKWEAEEQNDVSEETSQKGESNKIRETLIVRGNAGNHLHGNIVKNTSGTSQLMTPYEEKFPGTDLETQIGKSYEIWVHALKLNNKYFNQTLAYMSRGDRVTQLTQENSHGCFMVEVEKTWKNWYVCKKYLQDISDSSQSYKSQDSSVEESNTHTIATAVGSYYRVSESFEAQSADSQDPVNLQAMDILRQDTLATASHSCVQMRVVGSNLISNTGKDVILCSLSGIQSMQ